MVVMASRSLLSQNSSDPRRTPYPESEKAKKDEERAENYDLGWTSEKNKKKNGPKSCKHNKLRAVRRYGIIANIGNLDTSDRSRVECVDRGPSFRYRLSTISVRYSYIFYSPHRPTFEGFRQSEYPRARSVKTFIPDSQQPSSSSSSYVIPPSDRGQCKLRIQYRTRSPWYCRNVRATLITDEKTNDAPRDDRF